MITEIYNIAVVVSNAKRATEWYTSKLGFELKPESEDHWVVVGPRNATMRLHLCESGPMSGPVEPGNTGIGLQCDDIEKTVRELKERGVAFEKDLTRAEWGSGGSYAMIKDPDGNVYWLFPRS